MKKGTRLIKRAISLLLVLLFSINSFAAIVSDNDGSAFITKAEFDSLRNDFQSQIDNYNTSIDSKIDGAIAAYLAGIRLSQVSDLLTAIGDYYELPLVNYKSTLQVKKELEECYIALDFAGFWNFSDGSISQTATNPACLVANSEGEGHSGFKLDVNYVSEDTEYQIGTIYKKMNMKYESRTINSSSAYTGPASTIQMYYHGFLSVFMRQQTLVDASDSWWMGYMSGGNVGFAVVSKDKDSSSTLTTLDTPPNGASIREESGNTYSKFSTIGETSKKYQFIISNADVKVPIIGNNTYTRNFHIGMAKNKWPKKKSDDWQKVNYDVMTKNNPQYTSYKLNNLQRDVRFYLPTFVEKTSGTFNELDTLQKCAKLYTYFKVNDKNTKVYPISGAILAVMPNDVQKLDFIFDFKKTTNNKKYHLLFKKNEAFTASDITNLESIEYQLNGKKATKTDYADYGEIKVSIGKLDKGDVLWMTWVTNDDNDGGTLNQIVSAKMTTE